jgi:hypothetical protein
MEYKDKLNWTRPFTVYFDLANGLSNSIVSTKRKLSEMKNMFYDNIALENIFSFNILILSLYSSVK